MDSKLINDIRKTIELARKHEQQTSHLRKILLNSEAQLHRAIQLPANGSVEALLEFVVHYIEHVPEFIEAIAKLTEEAGIYPHVEPVLRIAQDYFLKPPELVDGHAGLDALMDEAYLAHRLIEEINDRFLGHSGIPLAPMDMTRANIIIHHLISEPFANELDHAVQYTVELLMAKEKIFKSEAFQKYIEDHRSRGWSEELERWPCLAADLSISLDFSHASTKENH